MAKRQNSGKLTAKTVGKVPEPALAALAEGQTVEFPDALSYINSLTGQREGVEWNIRVYKVDSSGRGVKSPQAFLFSPELEELPNLEGVLADQYPGGGSFKIVVRADGQIIRSALLEIAPRPGWKPPPPSYLTPVQPVAVDSQSTDRMELFFGRMAEMMERSAQQTRDMIAAIAARPAPAAPTMAEQLQMFAQFQSMLPKGAQENSMDLFQKGMDFAMKMIEARGGDGGTSWLDVVKEAINSPVVKDMITSMAAVAQNQQQQFPQQPPALMSPQNAIAAQAIDTLIRQAQAGIDPKMVAQQVVEKMPPALMEELENQPDVVGYLISQFPAVQQHRAWFTALVAEIWEEDQTPAVSPALKGNDAGPDNSVQPQA